MKKTPEKVKLSKDGSSIDFVASDNLPTSTKKFRQSPEIEGFYRFIFENDLRSEGFEILECASYGRAFSVLSEFIRFSAGSSKITDLITKIAKFLDKLTKNKIIYCDVYIVAKKK